jgi:outer membrane protein W
VSRATVVAVGISALLATTPAAGQSSVGRNFSSASWEASGLVAFVPSAELDRVAPQLDRLAIGGGFTWGLQAARFFSPNWGVEMIWTEQSSALEIDVADQTADLFTMTVGRLHGNAVYQFGGREKRLQPFAFAGLGTTYFRADDVESETKLSLGFGGGVKYFPWASVGIRGHFRYTPTLLNDDDAGDFCDPFGFCQSTLHQIETAAAVVIRF